MEEIKFLPLPASASELVEQTDAMTVPQSEEDVSSRSFFCTYWPMVAPGASKLIEELKWPWWKMAAEVGLSLINSLYKKKCSVPA